MRNLKEGCSVIGALMAICLFGAGNASAGPVGYGSFSGTVINFDGLAGSSTLGAGEVLASQYSGLGVTFSVPNFNAFATNGVLATDSSLTSLPNVIWVDQGAGAGGTNAQGMVINFSTAQSAVGIYFEGSLASTFTLAVYNGSTLLESTTSALGSGGAGLEGFLALQDSNITKAVVSSANSGGQNWNFSVDNLKFASAVPEPASVFTFTAGLAALLVGRRRLKFRK